MQGPAVLIRISTRRLFCRNGGLSFAEPLAAIAARSARRTCRLADLHRLIGRTISNAFSRRS